MPSRPRKILADARRLPFVPARLRAVPSRAPIEPGRSGVVSGSDTVRRGEWEIARSPANGTGHDSTRIGRRDLSRHHDQLVPPNAADFRWAGSGSNHDNGASYARQRTSYTRTASSIPLRACSPRSSNSTSADVRANPRTMSDTSTWPGADSPQMRDAMLTAPP